MSILGSEIYGMPNTFPEHLEEYCSRIAGAIRQNKHHDQRLGLLLDFLRKAFSLEVDEIELQRKVKAGSVRGRIDAFFRYIIFEMKSDLERERRDGLAELKKYFESQDYPHKYIGVISDGRRFEVYQYFDGEIDKVRDFAKGLIDLAAKAIKKAIRGLGAVLKGVVNATDLRGIVQAIDAEDGQVDGSYEGDIL